MSRANEPAFPHVEIYPDTSGRRMGGMTLREYAAIHAPSAEIETMMDTGQAAQREPVGVSVATLYARVHVAWADALLAELEKQR